ncbi:MAG: hypothetical protein K2N23_07695 [Clostridia bacterium]|nr:hypothetical protein [Clostridia bacterium]
MKFKHSISILIDNFSVTYKQLVYKLIISLITVGLTSAILYTFWKTLTNLDDFKNLIEGVKTFFSNLIDGNTEELRNIGIRDKVEKALDSINLLIRSNTATIALGIAGIILIRLVNMFFSSLGNYAAAAVINDKMALRAQSPFFLTLIRNLKDASLYSLMYVPLSFLYDVACIALMYFVVFKLLAFAPLLLQIFIFVATIVFAITVKLTFASDWLPALIRGKKKQLEAFAYTFNRKNKQTFNVLSNFVVLSLIIFALNVFAVIFTFGVGALITIPASYVVLNCFQLVNYYDREELKYFIDKNTIIKPEKEETVTREEFFRGE